MQQVICKVTSNYRYKSNEVSKKHDIPKCGRNRTCIEIIDDVVNKQHLTRVVSVVTLEMIDVIMTQISCSPSGPAGFAVRRFAPHSEASSSRNSVCVFTSPLVSLFGPEEDDVRGRAAAAGVGP